jgi:ribosomal protein L30/L7E
LAVVAKGTNQAALGLYHGFYSLPLVIIAAGAALRKVKDPVFHTSLAIGISLLSGMRLFRVVPPAPFVAKTAGVAAMVPPDVPVAAAPYVSLRLARRPYLRIVQDTAELREELGRTKPWVVLEGMSFRGMGGAEPFLASFGYEKVFGDTCFAVWRPR